MTVKGGYGIFYQPLTTSFYRGTTFRIYPYFAGVDIRQPTVFGPGNIAVLAAGVNPSTVQKRSEFIFYDVEQPFMQQWHVNFERDLGHNLVAEIGYIGSQGPSTCRSTAIPTRRRPSTAPTASSGWCPARRCAIRAGDASARASTSRDRTTTA